MTVEQHSRPPALIFGVPIDDVTMDESLDVIGYLVVSGRRQHRTHQVATVNVDFLVNALADESVRQLLQNADLCIADGMPVVWGAKAAAMPLRERVAGADLVPALVERAATTGWRIHLFGSSEGTAERSAQILEARFPGTTVTGASGPFITDIARVDEAVLAEIAELDPDILCVALGNPKQERFIHTYRDRLRTPVMIGVGGSLDILIGERRRAPVWVQRAGLEWVVRAAQEPGRLGRRYAHDARVFFPRLYQYVRRLRTCCGAGGLHYDIADAQVVVTTRPNGGRDLASWRRALQVVEQPGSLSTSLAESPALSVTAVAELVGLLRAAQRAGAPVQIGALSRPLMNQIRSLGLTTYIAGSATNP